MLWDKIVIFNAIQFNLQYIFITEILLAFEYRTLKIVLKLQKYQFSNKNKQIILKN